LRPRGSAVTWGDDDGMGTLTASMPAVEGWRSSAEQVARKLAPITVAGALLGVLVGGVGGRLAMKLLGVVNPSSTGIRSDDGFIIGQFTMSGSVALLAAGWQLGMVGAGCYALLRGLLIGPRWFRVLSISVGPGVVIGSQIVHTGGVDFTLLSPLWLTVGLFIAIPTVFAALLSLLAEHWIQHSRWFARARLRWISLTSLLWFAVAPLLLLLLVAWLVAEWLQRHAWLRRSMAAAVLPWLARAGLAAVFLLAVRNLISDITFLR
jgi:hypothetical protein